MSHGKMSYFVYSPLFRFTLVIKLRNFVFESHLITLIFFDKKVKTLYLNMSHGKVSDFVSFLLFGFSLVIKLGSFDFESRCNTLIVFDQKTN